MSGGYCPGGVVRGDIVLIPKKTEIYEEDLNDLSVSIWRDHEFESRDEQSFKLFHNMILKFFKYCYFIDTCIMLLVNFQIYQLM